MKNIFLLFLLILTALVPANADDLRGQARFFVGGKSLDSDDWGALDSQGEVGAEVDLRRDAWPVWLTTGFLFSRDSAEVRSLALPTREIEGYTRELYVGAKMDFFPVRNTKLSFSAGPMLAGASIEADSGPETRDSATALGGWVGGDLLVYLGGLGLGFSYRYSNAEADLLGKTRAIGGHHGGLWLGFGF